MVDNLIFSINAVLPIFLVMLFGIFLKEIKMLDSSGAKQMNAILFNFALPIKLFCDVSSSNLAALMDFQLIIFSVSTSVIWFFVCWGCALVFIKDRKMNGTFIQGCYRSNYAIIGLPLVSSIMGSDVAKAAIITTFVIPVFNILSVLILTIYSGEQVSAKETLISASKGVIKNPLIIGILSGVIFSFASFNLPQAMDKTLGYVTNLSTPLALISIGASMDFGKVKARIKPALLVSFLKLIAMPLVFLPVAMLMKMSAENIVILFVMYAAPTSVSSYVMSVYMNSDEALAANIVLFTSLLSIFTYTIGVYLLKTLGII